MNLRLERDEVTDASVIGKLYHGEAFICYTLEDVMRDEKVKGKTAIPYNTYEVVITFSPKFKQRMPLLLNVPEYEGIRIHPGNTAEHTEGCILVGNARGTDRISESRPAYKSLLAKMEYALAAGEKISIEIIPSERLLGER